MSNRITPREFILLSEERTTKILKEKQEPKVVKIKSHTVRPRQIDI